MKRFAHHRTPIAGAIIVGIGLILANPVWAGSHAEKCKALDGLTWVNGTDHCLVIKTFKPTIGAADTLVVVLHGDLSSGGPADYIFDVAAEAAKLKAVGIAMVRPGYTGDGRKSSGTPSRRQRRFERFTGRELDSIAAAIAALKSLHKAKRVVVIGHSGGALISGVLLGRAAPLINSVILISCPCNVPEWRESNDWRPLENAESPDKYLTNVPKSAQIFALTGERDSNTDPRFAKEYVAKAKELGLNASFTLIPGAGHNFNSIKKQPEVFDALRRAIDGS